MTHGKDGLRGALAGFAGTGMMTNFAINWLALRHPEFGRHHHPLSIVKWAAVKLGRQDPLREEAAWALARAIHYGFGAFGGSLYGLVLKRLQLPWPLKGLLLGWSLWVAAFCGYIPALGIYKPAWKFERPEKETTFLSHTVYGLTVALLMEALELETTPSGRGRTPLKKK